MKIRTILIALTSLLGTALLLTVTLQIRDEVLNYGEAQRLVASNAVREQLLLASAAMGEERAVTYLVLVRTEAEFASVHGIASARRRVDDAMKAAMEGLAAGASRLGDPATSLAALVPLTEALSRLRAQADAAVSAGDGPITAARWFRDMTGVIQDVQTFRFTLLRRERPQDPAIGAEALLRYSGGVLSESIARNQPLLARALASGSAAEPAELTQMAQNAGRADLVWEFIQDQASSELSAGVRSALNSAKEYHDATLAPLQKTILASLQGRTRPSIDAEQWYAAATRGLQAIGALQRELLVSSRHRLDAELLRSQSTLALRILLFLAGSIAAALSILVVRNRIVRPIEAISGAMLRLADNDLSTPIPRPAREDEIGLMSDALRVFKANAIKRHRLQQDKDHLHERLNEAYQQLHRDLEAAAAIQKTMLPAPAILGDVSFEGLHRPSSLIAGDTFNVLRRSAGKVGFFHVDVAGHGAPAALVSVASHHIVSQALLKRDGNAPLSHMVAEINADWPEDLPYFTMIVGEIDARSGRGVMVQAGHPPPLRIKRNGSMYLLGNGGFPVGMVPSATYDDLTFELRPGDRLVLYSDGVVEAEDGSGQPFSEERLHSFLRAKAASPTATLLQELDAELRRWRGSDRLDDDLSVLILER